MRLRDRIFYSNRSVFYYKRNIMKIIPAMANSDEDELSGSGLVEYKLLENIILLYYDKM
jgi:hypothetical protein